MFRLVRVAIHGDASSTMFHFWCFQPQAKDGKNVSSADWVLDPKELESKFNEKTKMIVLNTPHNPTGKVVLTLLRLESASRSCAAVTIGTLCWKIIILRDSLIFFSQVLAARLLHSVSNSLKFIF